MKPVGRRIRERCRKRWTDDIKDDLWLLEAWEGCVARGQNGGTFWADEDPQWVVMPEEELFKENGHTVVDSV